MVFGMWIFIFSDVTDVVLVSARSRMVKYDKELKLVMKYAGLGKLLLKVT